MVVAIDLIIQWQGIDAPSYARRFRSAANISDFSPVLREIAYKGIAPAVRANFESQGRPKWVPLSEETLKTKIRKGYVAPQRILVATGALMEDASDPAGYVIGPDFIRATPSVTDYWIYHQSGTTRMPQRVIMSLQRGDQRRIGGMFNKFIREELAKHGLKTTGTTSVIGGG